MKYKIDERVVLVYHPSTITGIIKQVSTGNPIAFHTLPPRYLIVYDQKDLIPPEDWHGEDELEIFLEPGGLRKNLTCECGTDIIGSDKHSDWCPKWQKI